MADQPELQIGFAVDVESLQQGLTESEQLMQQAAQRMAGIGQGASPAVVSSPQGGAPPVPPPPPAMPAPTRQQGDGELSPLQAGQSELERIRALAEKSPDVAMAALSGRGGLAGRIQKSAASSDGEESEAFQELLQSIRELSKGIRDQIKQVDDSKGDGGPASGILNFLKANAMLGVAGQAGQQLLGGDVLGAAGTGIGGGLGFLFGGPLGAQAGAQIGGMATGALSAILGGADEMRQYGLAQTDMAARFGALGNTGTMRGLGFESVQGMDRQGYSTQETQALFDALRQNNVINEVDEESRQMVQELQALSRALGENTNALVQSYSTYRQTGGTGSVNDYMAQMISGAVSAGMRENLDQYREIVGSASMGLTYQNMSGDYGGGGMRGIQGVLTQLMGQNNRMSSLLQDNPMMAQQMLQTVLGAGSTQSVFSADAASMAAAGIRLGDGTEGYITPEQQAQNAMQRYSALSENFMQTAPQLLGFGSQEELMAAAQANPNIVQERVMNGPNDFAAQMQLDSFISQYMGRDPSAITATDRATAMQLFSSYASNGGTLNPEAVLADGSTVEEVLAEYEKTDADRAREAEEARHTEMMALLGEFAPLISALDETAVEILQFLNDPVKPAMEAFLKDVAPVLAAMGDAAATVGEATGIMPNFLSGVGSAATAMERYSEGDRMGALASAGQAVLDTVSMTPFSPFGAARQAQQFIDGFFNDTPPGGVLATEGYNTFEFAPGDVIHASQGGAGAGGDRSSRETNNIVLNQTLNFGAADPETVRRAARSGISSGADEFIENWRNRNRGGVRRDVTNY